MFFNLDRCLQCRTPNNPGNLYVKPTKFWFCSEECASDAVTDMVPKEYQNGLYRTNDDYPPIKELKKALEEKVNTGDMSQDKGQHAYVSQSMAIWNEYDAKKKAAWAKASKDMLNRVREEWDFVLKKRAEDEAEAAEKERQKQLIESEREAIRMERENERKARELERDRERQERDDEKRRVEDEKLVEKERMRIEQDDARKPRKIPDILRFEHTHILGGSGAGKSTLIIREFFNIIGSIGTAYGLPWQRRPSVVLIDPKGTLADRLARFEGYYEDQLIYIDPTIYPCALNMFAKPKRTYTQEFQDQMETLTCSLLQYIFSSKGAALTDKQSTAFSYAIRLISSIPDADIRTLSALLLDKPNHKIGGVRPDSPFKPYIDRLDPTARAFFENRFYDATDYAPTKDQIATRIDGLLRVPTFQKMFFCKENTLDMFSLLQTPCKVVLIGIPIGKLGEENTTLLARYMVALVVQGIFERSVLPKSEWLPSFLIIDEAQLVMDEIKTPQLFNLAREYRLGVTIAHQNIEEQLSDALFSTISSSTRTKYASTASGRDAAMMARNMRCDPGFILDQPITDKHGSFACYSRGITPHPFSYGLNFEKDNQFPMVNDERFSFKLMCMKYQYGAQERAPEEARPPFSQSQTAETHEGSSKPEPSCVVTSPPAHADADPIVPEEKQKDKPKPWRPKKR